MAKNIETLREKLFDAMESLESGKMDIEKAQAISQLAKVVVESAKAEVNFIRVTGGYEGSGFIPCEPREPLPDSTKTELPRLGR